MPVKRTEITVDPNEVDLQVRQIEKFIGYSEGESHEHIALIIEELIVECRNICELKAEYMVIDDPVFDNIEKSIELAGLNFYTGKIIVGQLKKADSIAVFLATAGHGPGRRSREYMAEGDPVKGYILDVIGSEIVEATADIMQASLAREMELTGKKISNRFSPGYCGWDVKEQHKLFSLLPDNFCGITLTPSALMDPVKSVSGFIGAGSEVRFHPYTCNFCDMKDCIYRRRA